MKSKYLSLVATALLVGTQAFASSYTETPIADCGKFAMLEVEVGAQSPDGSVSLEKTMIIRDLKGEEFTANRTQSNSWEFMLNEEQSIIIKALSTPVRTVYLTYNFDFGMKDSLRTCVTK